ncbi:MAG: hypothetical protein ACOX2O_07255 [Bdellovibrionota bacterium]|jgi:hypothetical protein
MASDGSSLFSLFQLDRDDLSEGDIRRSISREVIPPLTPFKKGGKKMGKYCPKVLKHPRSTAADLGGKGCYYLEAYLSEGLRGIIFSVKTDLPPCSPDNATPYYVSKRQFERIFESFVLDQTQSGRFNVEDCKIGSITTEGSRRSGYVILTQKTEIDPWRWRGDLNLLWSYTKQCSRNLPSFKKDAASPALPECFETFSLISNKTGKRPLLVSDKYKRDSSFLIAYTLPSTKDNMGVMGTDLIIRDICALQEKQIAEGKAYLHGELGIGVNNFNQIVIKGSRCDYSSVPYEHLKSVARESITNFEAGVLSNSTSVEISYTEGDLAARCLLIPNTIVNDEKPLRGYRMC